MRKVAVKSMLLWLFFTLSFFLISCSAETTDDGADGICPYTLCWNGQLYRSYAEKVKDVDAECVIGEIVSVCSPAILPEEHGQANCLTVGCPIAEVNDELAVLVNGAWLRFYPIDIP